MSSISVRIGSNIEACDGPSIPVSNSTSVRLRRRRHRSRPLAGILSTSVSWPLRISILLSAATFVVVYRIARLALPGKNYFDPGYWRRSNHVADYDALVMLQTRFPVHVGMDDFEVVIHPGYLMADKEKLDALTDGKGYFVYNLTVPKFWNPVEVYGDADDNDYSKKDSGGRTTIRKFLGDHGKYLITPEEAGAIGSFHGTRETIFVSIASYRDPECLPTVESIFARAKYPERIRVAIVDQRQHERDDPICQAPSVQACLDDPDHILCPYARQIDRIEYPSQAMVGPVLARHIAHRMYRGEYFALQVDSHVRFVAGWDEDIIDQWQSTGNEMAVLTTYMNDITNSIDPVSHVSMRPQRAMMCALEYEWEGDPKEHIRFKIQPISKPRSVESPMLHPFWAAGFSFSRGHFVISVPYDPYLPLVFQGEEILQTIRGFTHGYDFYAPSRNIAFHIYASRENAEIRNNVHKFDENEIFFPGVKKAAYLRLIGISGTTKPPPAAFFDQEAATYGLGNVRSKEKFFATFGIHPDSNTIEEGLCDFVQGTRMETSMDTAFQPFMRYDKMGIDYSRINYRHHTPDRSDTPVNPKELAYLREKLRRSSEERTSVE